MIAREHGTKRLWKLIKNIHIRRIGGSCKRTFEEVVTQDLILRECSVKRREKCINVKRSLAGKAPFKKDVLVYFRKYGGVGAEALLVKENARETKSVSVSKPLFHLRLDEGVSARERTGCVEVRHLKRMCVNAEYIFHEIPRDKRIFIEGDNKIRLGEFVCRQKERRGRRSPSEDPSEVEKLSAFSFPAHPNALLRRPDA